MSGDVSRDAVLAVLDDAAAAASLLDASTALAQLTHRELQLVYVESAAALAAAALPVTRVLAPAAHDWSPFAPEDVERGWRVQAARLRTLAQTASLRRAVSWSLRITRGSLQATATALHAQADLLVVGGAPLHALPASPRRIVALDDGTAGGRQAVRLARQLAGLLGARVQVERAERGSALPVAPQQADLLVVPRGALAPQALAASPVPVLVVAADGAVDAPGHAAGAGA